MYVEREREREIYIAWQSFPQGTLRDRADAHIACVGGRTQRKGTRFRNSLNHHGIARLTLTYIKNTLENKFLQF